MSNARKEHALLARLADGQCHTRREIAASLGLAIDELPEILAALATKGLDVRSINDGTYQLARPIELLDAGHIRASLAAAIEARISDLEIVFSTESTNTRLLDKPAEPSGAVQVCLAEYQSAGRGRMRRPWHSPLGGGLCMSVAWSLARTNDHIATAGLVAGVAVRKALEQCGVRQAMLKWPNDLVQNGRKLGGLLLETRGQGHRGSQASAKLVLGIGLNYFLDSRHREIIGELGGLQPGDIVEACGGNEPGRNLVLATILSHLLPALEQFSTEGFAPFVDAWRFADVCKDKSVRVLTPTGELAGVARGINASGALQVEIDGEIMSIVSAQVSLRPE